MVEFTQEVFDTLCDRLVEGNSLRTICKSSDMPSAEAVRKWLKKDEAGEGLLVAQYARARQEQADTLFEDCLDIADAATPEEVQAARLRIDTRKWMAGKMRPKKYGDKLDVDAKVGLTVNLPTGSENV